VLSLRISYPAHRKTNTNRHSGFLQRYERAT